MSMNRYSFSRVCVVRREISRFRVFVSPLSYYGIALQRGFSEMCKVEFRTEKIRRIETIKERWKHRRLP